jgi:hypothetical protein
MVSETLPGKSAKTGGDPASFRRNFKSLLLKTGISMPMLNYG